MSGEKGLSSWQLTILALGTVVGGSFFLGAAIAIRAAGPASLLSFAVGGALVYVILTSLSEMTVADPAPGSFRTYTEQLLGPAMGFVIGWVYWSGLTLAMSSEATAISVFLRRWIPQVSLPVFAVAVVVLVTLLNLAGARSLARLETGLASIKLLAVAGFIVLAVVLIGGLIPGRPVVGLGAVRTEPFFPGGLGGVAGSMLIVIFTYAGFEVIGLAAPEAENPHRTVPRAILQTILGLVGLYMLAVAVLLPLVPTAQLNENVSPLVMALTAGGLSWAGSVINVVLVTAILSTMLAAMFGLGRMVRSLAIDGHAPAWLMGRGDEPRRGILFSGASMLIGVGLGFVLPQGVYVFLVSSGGFALLFVYITIVVAHMRFRRRNGCPPKGRCQLPGYPWTSIVTLVALVAIAASMPLVPGQGSGLIAGLSMVAFYGAVYGLLRLRRGSGPVGALSNGVPQFGMETGDELTPDKTGEEDKSS